MSLLQYESMLSRLNVNRAGGSASPHKVAMLSAVMDLIESGQLTDNRIEYSELLLTTFSRNFAHLRGPNDRNNPHLPFFHLRSEGFWHHHLLPGKSESYNRLSTASGPGVIREHIAYASLDDELFELMQNQFVRDLLRASLQQNLVITESNRREILSTDGWDWLECEACVQDYFAMLNQELGGRAYNKTEHRTALMQKLQGRSKGSVEFKHQNISAVLLELGLPYIAGYKPRFNYQAQLRDVVLAHLAAHQGDIDSLLTPADQPPRPYTTDWNRVLDAEIPERFPAIAKPERQYLARKTNYVQREALNRHLGESGERFVVEFEKHRLTQAGREDLAREVEWSSKERGDGLGYDVRSFALEGRQARDEERFIEVKTTRSGKYQSFLMSENEVAFSRDFAEQYNLYRVYEFKEKPRLFVLTGRIDQFVNLHPKTFEASFR